MYRKYFKRILDIVCSLGFILCFWWLYILVAVLVKRKLGSPVIFKQQRPGLNGRIFIMYKFRSMTDTKDKDGKPLDIGMDIFERGLCLPSDNKMTPEEQDIVIEIIRKCFEE